MAMSTTVDRTIHQGVCNLSIKQKFDASPTCTPLQNHGAGRCTPIHTDCNGPHHRVTKKLWSRCHPNYSQSQMQLRRNIPPMSDHDHRTPNRPTILSTCLPLVQTPQMAHIRPRPEVHVPLRESLGQRIGNLVEPLNGI